jgi:xanthine dehydrogenase molybdenum-binding subunit
VAETKLIGQNYTTPDLVAKVTGKARYAEDYRADGMLFCKLLLSPMPHARVRGIDASAALRMDGVKAVLRADDFPEVKPDPTGLLPERALTNEPLYQGEPVLAVAAVDEATAAEAIERIQVDFEPLPFAVDPLESLKPTGANARLEGNVYIERKIATLKWTDQDFASATEGKLPMGKATGEWAFGDVEEGFKQAELVLDETFIVPSTAHQPLETRTAMAYWQNGKLYLYGSTQSTVRTVASVAGWVGVPADNVIVISEYTGGGFGSKIPGAHSMAIPALLAKKTGQPVMMRISREEEHYIGRARAGMQARAKVGFRKDGRITAFDLFIIMDNGPYSPQGDARSAGDMASLAYQPMTMRFRDVTVLTNTPPRTSQRSPGGMQSQAILEPIIAKAARKLGIDQVAIHAINAPAGKAPFGAPDPKTGKQRYTTSANVKEALEKGAALFGWDERKQRSGKRQGSKARGIGLAVSPYTSGSIGFDGLMIIRPDGKLQIQSGIGNLGTHSVIDVTRVAAEVLGMPWDQCEVIFGNTEKNLPWSCVSAGSQTTHAMTRANHAAAMDAKKKLQEIAAKDLGGSPEGYEVGNGRVFAKGNPGRGMTFAQAATRALALGGKFDGHELPEDINAFTKKSAAALAGLGLMGVAKDNYPRDGNTQSFVVGFAEVEVDVETGVYQIINYTAVGDVGTVIHPRSLSGQIFGGSMLGIGHAIGQKFVYDQQYGVALAKRFHHNRPPTILDTPLEFKWDVVGIPDPETPVGAKGVGEPPVGAGYGAILTALADALGDEVFRRAPVTADIILTSLESGTRKHEPFAEHV